MQKGIHLSRVSLAESTQEMNCYTADKNSEAIKGLITAASLQCKCRHITVVHIKNVSVFHLDTDDSSNWIAHSVPVTNRFS